MEYENWNGLNVQATSPATWVIGAAWDAAAAEVAVTPARRLASGTNAQPKREIVRVVELTPDEVDRLWSGDLFVPPTDDDVFVRCQKIVVAYAAYHGLNIDRATYSRAHALKRARSIARPLAALAAGIPLTADELSQFAFWIWDALASWAPAEDAGAHAIARLFRTYALPEEDGDYQRVKA